jgi:hypothetical protein
VDDIADAVAAYDELEADYRSLREERDNLLRERDVAERRGAQRERERIARLFDDLYPEWAQMIREGVGDQRTVSESFDKLREKYGHFFDGINADEWVAQLRDEDDEHTSFDQDVCMWHWNNSLIRQRRGWVGACGAQRKPNESVPKTCDCGRPIRIEGWSNE